MFEDEQITIDNATEDELNAFHEMEKPEEVQRCIVPYTLAKHREQFAADGIRYKSIYDRRGSLVGFLILALDPDGRSLEFRRIVISERGRGYGKRAVTLVDQICRKEFGRRRVWLDVFQDNMKARNIYESAGYVLSGTADFEGKNLLIYEKTV
ncbi:MAG: GNAT family N-acetyltransferase [Spirochaetales bacterium]|nr:GNAT family N-acetyltransferase [Spirochaetales bacterium]